VFNNAPTDLFSDGTSTTVVFKKNHCDASEPPGLCSGGPKKEKRKNG
jgi:hypothetical protein